MKSFFTLVTVLLLSGGVFSQNVAINGNGAAPNSSAILDVDVSSPVFVTKKGVLIPRVTTAQRIAILTPAQSLLVFDTDYGCFFYYYGAVWQDLCSSAVRTLFPQPVYPSFNSGDVYLSDNNVGCVGMFRLENPMAISSVTLTPSQVSTPGILRVGIYTEDGQTKLLDQVTGVISSTSAYTQTLSTPVSLRRGNYYFVVIPLPGVDMRLYVWQCFVASAGSAYSIPGEAVPAGIINVSPGLLPASFSPVTDVTYFDQQHSLPIVRFDN